jgi:hypothetical protein
MKSTIVLLILSTFVTACATTTDRIKLVSTDAKSGTITTAGERVTGESCRKSILFVIPLERDGSLEDAIANALEKTTSGNAITDMKVTRKVLTTIFYNYRCTMVEGRLATVK